MAYKTNTTIKTRNGTLTAELLKTCREKLLQMKSDILNRSQQAAQNFNQIDKASGDEIDQSAAHQEEHTFLINQSRLKSQLLEIELALGRMEQGSYGICEETEEIIESDRLLAIPHTRYSIEGAEMRENLIKKFAR
ncbi:MAG: molecular chaperone DnaK [Bdellovibrionales bacterium RIFCSPHIGHO2_01_FULL_40_29]|nr:MAG: molecular chaperone DnaK [Bdellovibrionales bacterium RIFCSPHIGHO2_01_FULL_40_29]OFZ34707.1 MAG: molecular chaperone DnaK [Bdellovibrionales bacterium RIFCSPHIGHO2_02_FULL_40_15]